MALTSLTRLVSGLNGSGTVDPFILTGNRPNGPAPTRASPTTRLLGQDLMKLGFAFKKLPSACLGGRGLASTCRDLSLFWRMILNQGELGGVRVLSPESVRFLQEDRFPWEGDREGVPLDWLRSVGQDGLGAQGMAMLGYRSSDSEYRGGSQEGMIQHAGSI
jgi:CubicO group peptidase (beta-lactamase class C family)